MTTPEIVAENRRKAVHALRTTELPQGGGEFYNPKTGCYCALGIMSLVAGLSLTQMVEPWFELEDVYGIDFSGGSDSQKVIYRMSDNGKSFSEIGDHLAKVWGIV